jgi:hypothetical protein
LPHPPLAFPPVHPRNDRVELLDLNARDFLAQKQGKPLKPVSIRAALIDL